MADLPLAELDGKTPLGRARTPALDRIAAAGRVGTARTTPDGLEPGSDLCHLALLGYDPRTHFTGRAPLEAAHLGLELGPDDVAIRCNLITMDPSHSTIEQFAAGYIENNDARPLVEAIGDLLPDGPRLHFQNRFCHLLLWPGAREIFAALETSPPHQIMGEPSEKHLPRGPGSDRLRAWMLEAREALTNHPVSRDRRDRGLLPVTDVWPWSPGATPSLESFRSRHGLRAALISAVPVVRGIGFLTGMNVLEVAGATGSLATDYAAKGAAACEAIEGHDLVVVHIEAPDEASHLGDAPAKVEAIERIDRLVVTPIVEHLLAGQTRFEIAVIPDHFTCVSTRAHASGAPPYARATREELFEGPGGEVSSFSEDRAAGGTHLDDCLGFATSFLGTGARP